MRPGPSKGSGWCHDRARRRRASWELTRRGPEPGGGTSHPRPEGAIIFQRGELHEHSRRAHRPNRHRGSRLRSTHGLPRERHRRLGSHAGRDHRGWRARLLDCERQGHGVGGAQPRCVRSQGPAAGGHGTTRPCPSVARALRLPGRAGSSRTELGSRAGIMALPRANARPGTGLPSVALSFMRSRRLPHDGSPLPHRRRGRNARMSALEPVRDRGQAAGQRPRPGRGHRLGTTALEPEDLQ
jgi:hypothetical protein